MSQEKESQQLTRWGEKFLQDMVKPDSVITIPKCRQVDLKKNLYVLQYLSGEKDSFPLGEYVHLFVVNTASMLLNQSQKTQKAIKKVRIDIAVSVLKTIFECSCKNCKASEVFLNALKKALDNMLPLKINQEMVIDYMVTYCLLSLYTISFAKNIKVQSHSFLDIWRRECVSFLQEDFLADEDCVGICENTYDNATDLLRSEYLSATKKDFPNLVVLFIIAAIICILYFLGTPNSVILSLAGISLFGSLLYGFTHRSFAVEYEKFLETEGKLFLKKEYRKPFNKIKKDFTKKELMQYGCDNLLAKLKRGLDLSGCLPRIRHEKGKSKVSSTSCREQDASLSSNQSTSPNYGIVYQVAPVAGKKRGRKIKRENELGVSKSVAPVRTMNPDRVIIPDGYLLLENPHTQGKLLIRNEQNKTKSRLVSFFGGDKAYERKFRFVRAKGEEGIKLRTDGVLVVKSLGRGKERIILNKLKQQQSISIWKNGKENNQIVSVYDIGAAFKK